MKLINFTTRFYMIAFLVILAIWSLVFFAILKYNIRQDTDKYLMNKKENIVDEFIEDGMEIDNDFFEYSDFKIKPVDESRYKNGYSNFSDTLIYEKSERSTVEYRKFESYFDYQGNYFRLTIIKPTFETNRIIKTIAIILASLYFVIVFVLVVSGRLLTQHVWKPFYKTLESVKAYSFTNHKPLQTVKSNINEFEQLNQSLKILTENNYKTYISQKQFIENASHEMQTPLSVILSKCELIYQDPNLLRKTAVDVEKIHDAANRLSKMNQSLLLLTKIENNQFSDKSPESVSEHILKIIDFFEDIKRKKELQLTVSLENNIIVDANHILLEIMLTNLIKNAFVHNVQQGTVNISLKANKLEIENSRQPLPIEKERLFKRFGKQSDNKDGLGLGLSIVKEICEIHGWQINCMMGEKGICFYVNF